MNKDLDNLIRDICALPHSKGRTRQLLQDFLQNERQEVLEKIEGLRKEVETKKLHIENQNISKWGRIKRRKKTTAYNKALDDLQKLLDKYGDKTQDKTP